MMNKGEPDYSVAAMKKQYEELKSWQQQLQNFEVSDHVGSTPNP